MEKKTTAPSKAKSPPSPSPAPARRPDVSKAVAAAPAAPIASTTVRNTTLPPKASNGPAAQKPLPSYAEIERRAYQIWQSGTGGSPDENWLRAERELRDGRV